METIFHSHANKTHFHKKGCVLGLVLKVRGFGTRNLAYLHPLFYGTSYQPKGTLSKSLCRGCGVLGRVRHRRQPNCKQEKTSNFILEQKRLRHKTASRLGLGKGLFPSLRTSSFLGFFTSDRRSRGRRSQLLKAPIKTGSTVQFDGPTAQCACHARLITFVNFSSSSERILILVFLWYKATNFRGIGGDCRLAAPTDFIRGISPGKLDSFRLVSSSVSDERGSVINDYL